MQPVEGQRSPSSTIMQIRRMFFFQTIIHPKRKSILTQRCYLFIMLPLHDNLRRTMFIWKTVRPKYATTIPWLLGALDNVDIKADVSMLRGLKSTVLTSCSDTLIGERPYIFSIALPKILNSRVALWYLWNRRTITYRREILSKIPRNSFAMKMIMGPL